MYHLQAHQTNTTFDTGRGNNVTMQSMHLSRTQTFKTSSFSAKSSGTKALNNFSNRYAPPKLSFVELKVKIERQ